MEKQEKAIFHQLCKSVNRMETALLGDDKIGIEGVVGKIKRHDIIIEQYRADLKKVEEHDKIIEQYKSDRNKVVAGAMVGSTFLVVLWEGIKNYFK